MLTKVHCPSIGKMLHPYLKIMSIGLISLNILGGHLSSVEITLIWYCSVEADYKLR